MQTRYSYFSTMFGKGKKSAAGLTLISPGTRLCGETHFEGEALVAGELQGTIHGQRKVTIEAGGLIDGILICNELKVSGQFRGKLKCDRLIIAGGGSVEGEVTCVGMEIFEGGQFIGIRTRELPAPDETASTSGQLQTPEPSLAD